MHPPRSAFCHVGLLNTHPVQYYAPWYKALAQEIHLEVFYCHRQTAGGQAQAGFGVEFEWDVPLLEGYRYHFLDNHSRSPNVSTFAGCDTPEIREIIAQSRFDAFIVHGWYVKSFWQAMLACWQTGVPLLVRGDSQLNTARSLPRRWMKYLLYRSFIPRFDGYLVVGERSRQYYLHYGADPERMFFVPHSVDNEFFSNRTTQLRAMRDQLRLTFNLPADALVFLFAGKLIPKKRPQDFIRGIALASRNTTNLYGLVVGDGPLRSELEEVVKQQSLPVRFAGFLNQTEMPNAYAASDVLVLPSDGGETWGLVVNEAMASGLPAIVSDQVGCGPDLVAPGKTGYVFACGNVSELADIFTSLLQNRSAIARLSDNAHNRIRQYSIDWAVQGTVEALGAVMRQ